MTQGYNPHPRISFPLALGTGMVGEHEVMEFQLREWLPPASVRERLTRELPPDIVIRDLDPVSPRGGAVVTALRYRVRFLGTPPVSEDELAELLVHDRILVRRQRKGGEKTVDIRPFISRLRLQGDILTMECVVNQGSTTRPEEVLEALGVDVAGWLGRMEIVRTDTVLAEPQGARGDGSRPVGRRLTSRKR